MHCEKDKGIKAMKCNCAVLIPAYNPPDSFPDYLRQLCQAGLARIMIVDDGSGEDRKKIFQEAERIGCVVLHHQENKGKGAALKTGFSYYQEHWQGSCDGIVTVNSDGSNLPEDVLRIGEALHNGQRMGFYGLVLGARDFSSPHISRSRRNGNKITCLIYKALTGISVKDALTGLRGIPDMRIPECIGLWGSGYEYEASMLLECGHAGYLEVSVETPPPGQETETHYRPVRDTVRIYLAFFRRFLMFSMTSVSVSLLDIFLFWLLTEYCLKGISYPLAWGTVIARVISAAVNYLINRYLVFQSNEDGRRSAGMFVVLSTVQCLLSAGLVQALEYISSGEPVLLKVIVDVGLFFLSYFVQNRWIFKKES